MRLVRFGEPGCERPGLLKDGDLLELGVTGLGTQRSRAVREAG